MGQEMRYIIGEGRDRRGLVRQGGLPMSSLRVDENIVRCANLSCARIGSVLEEVGNYITPHQEVRDQGIGKYYPWGRRRRRDSYGVDSVVGFRDGNKMLLYN